MLGSMTSKALPFCSAGNGWFGLLLVTHMLQSCYIDYKFKKIENRLDIKLNNLETKLNDLNIRLENISKNQDGKVFKQ